ncbi:MAG: radical SAM protein [Armatimonadetes bacterium]|nr:radical SAM protein [Armatimonadota bacterium]
MPARPSEAVLVFPPQWSPRHPHYALTALGGHLRSRGFHVHLADLNLEFYERVLTPEYLARSRDRLMVQYRYLYPRAMLASMTQRMSPELQFEAMKYMAMEKFLKEHGALLEELPDKVLDAVETLRDPRRFYNPEFLVAALYVLDRALELVSLPYHPAQLSLAFFEQPDCLLATEDLVRITGDSERNMFFEFMREQAQKLLELAPRSIGISINAFSQVVPGLTLARWLREHAPEGCHINIGGNFFHRVADVLQERPRFFEVFCHSLVLGEGERPMELLLGELRNPCPDLSRVPGLLYLHGDRVERTATQRALPMTEVGIQDLEGLSLERYLAPEPVLCIRASKGCYWARCSFCDTFYGVEHERRTLDQLVAEIRHVRDRYGVRHFQFIDDCIPPRRMKAMAERFLEEDLRVEWFCNGRLDKGFHQEILEVAHRAGLRMVLWGVESGSSRILGLINKGVHCDGRFDLLRRSAEVGIWNFAYIFFGFPTETREEAMLTIEMLCARRDIIHSYGRSVFTLGKHSELYRNREKYGILSVVQDVEELSTNLHYASQEGMTDREVDEMMKLCTSRCTEAWGRSLWFFLRYRENIHLYLSRYGLAYVDQTRVHVNQELVGVW